MTTNDLDLKKQNQQLKQELEEARQQLSQIKVEMKQLDALKDEFVSIASHELRTPLTAIQSYIWIALSEKSGALNEKQRHYLRRSYEATQRLINLVNDLLNISRIESGRMEMDFEQVNLAQLYEEIIDEVRPRADELELKISLDYVDHGDQPLVVADKDKIHEVLLNLIGNSFKFTPKGGHVNIKIERKDHQVETQVTDTGVGMSQASLKNLFKKFGFMKDSYRSQHEMEEGAGLGLFICKLIIDLHQGKINATSPGENQGTTFTFTLPVYTEKRMEELKKQQKKSGIGIIHYTI